MSKTLVPAGEHVLVVDMPRETTIDDISLPDNVRQQEMVFGTVVFIGPKVSDFTKPKDQVCYGPYAGKNVVIGGVEFRLLLEEQIESYVRESNDGTNDQTTTII